MKKKFFLLILLTLSFNFVQAQGFFKLGYGTHGYRLGFEVRSGYPVAYVTLFAENKYKEGDYTSENTTYSYSLSNFYLNLGLSFYTKLRSFYFQPFIKIRRSEFKIENNNTTVDWAIGGGLNFLYYAYLFRGIAIVPQAYIFYMPEKTFYYKNEKIVTTGKNALQVGLALDLDIGF